MAHICFFSLNLQPAGNSAIDDPRAELIIRVFHEDCGDDIIGRNCIFGVRVETQKSTVVIEGSSVKINGDDYSASIENQPFLSRNLYVKQATSLFMLIRGFGFRVLFGFRRVYISIDPFYDNKVRICSTPDLTRDMQKGCSTHMRIAKAQISLRMRRTYKYKTKTAWAHQL